MKKTFKIILCAILVLTMAFGTLTAFAADGDSIYWESGEEISFAGELKEGSNTVSYPGGRDFIYVTFNAEKDGYYAFAHEPENDYWVTCIELDENRKITYSADMGNEFSFYDFEYEKTYTIIDLKAGENTLALLWEEEEASEETVSVSYMGKEITGVDFSAGIDYAFVYGNGIGPGLYEIVDAEYQYYFYTEDFVVTFDSGETLMLESSYVWFECETAIEENMYDVGVYDIGVYFGKKTVPARIEVRPMTYFVENAEADNPEDFIIAEYYDGTQEFVPYEGTFTVTLKNGEKIKVNEEWEYVVIPGADPDGYWLNVIEDDEDNTAEVRLAGYGFEKSECTVQEATTEQNFNYMTEKIADIFYNFKWGADYFYDIMVNAGSKADTLRAFGTWISHINNNILPVLGNIIGEFFEFVGYEILHL